MFGLLRLGAFKIEVEIFELLVSFNGRFKLEVKLLSEVGGPSMFNKLLVSVSLMIEFSKNFSSLILLRSDGSVMGGKSAKFGGLGSRGKAGIDGKGG